MKKPIALFMAAAMVVSLAGCGSDDGDSSQGGTQQSSDNAGGSTSESSDAGSEESSDAAGTEEGDSAESEESHLDANSTQHIYKDAVSVLASNWNPHTYQTSDDGYPLDFIVSGFYEPVYNDALHEVEGMEPFEGYKFIPLMAASDPVDVTETVKAEHPEYGIPESATAGFAYTIDLNPDAKWEDGTAINADSYIYSMQALLDPVANNYRATDYYNGNFVIAGAEAYANSGKEIYKANSADGEAMDFALADFVKGEDGTYTTPDGEAAFIGLNEGYEWMGGNSLADYNGAGYIPEEVWSVLSGAADEDGWCPVTDENLAALYEFTGSDVWGNEPEDQLAYYISYKHQYPVQEFSSVGLYKSGDYQITLVFAVSLSGFNLYYNLSGPTWLVKEDIYESCKRMNGDAYTSTYYTSVDTTCSYGPYKLVEFQSDKAMRFEKNENWVGYTDGQHKYVDPEDGQTYDMYQTDVIDCQVVSEASTRKMMFLRGELMGYGLQSEDYATYRNSEYVYATPATTTFFFIFNGYLDAIKNREANADFDQSKYDLETMTLESFRRAVAVTYDKELFASTVSPSRKGGYGLIGSAYVYDPDTGAKYRDTDQAKQVLCDFYSVDVSEYSSLDEAVASITGYDPVAAKELYTEAFNEALDAGYITDADGDGISDQTISIEYALSEDSDFMTTTINYLNEKMAEVTQGTPFEGKVEFVKSAPYGNDWSTRLKAGMTDTVLAGWQGSMMNPFDIIRLYTNGTEQQYDYQWFDASRVNLELTVNGEAITMNLRQWSEALLGSTVTVGGRDYNFGEADADVDTRLTILAALEGQILQTYDYIPVLEDGSMALLSQQVFYVVDDYSPLMGRGGIAYMKYNYNEKEWAAYVASQSGELSY